MSPAPAIVSHLEEALHPIEPGGMWTCSGWIFGQGTTRCCAVRACGTGPTAHGLLGIPRPDVAAAYPAALHAAFSGFRINLHNPNHLPARLEWLDEAGCWHEFWREPVPDRVARPGQATSPLLPTRLVRAVHSAAAMETTGLSWRAAWRRADKLVEDYTCLDTPIALCPDLLMHLDQPPGEFRAGQAFPVSGWIVSRRLPVRRVFAQVEPGGLVHMIFPRPRPDVAAAHPTPPTPVLCGFEGMVMPPVEPPAWLYLRLYVETADGSVVLAVSRRFFRQHPPTAAAGQCRATLLLGALAFANVYRPQSWPHWLRELRPRLRQEKSVTSPDKSLPALGQPPDLALTVEPREGDPLISILVPVFNTPRRYLVEMIASVQAQRYPRWELCLADDASTTPHVRALLEESARADPRIRPVFRPENGHIARATNTALAHARGVFVALLDHDDRLAPEVLLRIVETIRTRPDAEFIYTDRDKIDDEDRHYDVEERGAWNPAMAMTHNYLHHLTVIRRSLVERAGAFRPECVGSQDLDLYLRCHELVKPGQIVHVPVIGYHWRAHAGSTATRGDQKDYMFDSARRGIVDALRRRQLRAEPFLPDFARCYGLNLHQLRWDPAILRDNPLSIVVAVTSARSGLWPQCLARLLATVPAEHRQIIVASAGALPREQPSASSGDPEFVVTPTGTSLGELFNLGAARARNPLLLLLEVGARPVTSGWLEDLAGWLSFLGVAATGPKLIATDGTLASAGWTINRDTSLPQPQFAGEPEGDLGQLFLPHAARDVLLLDSSCVLTRTTVFRELEGYASHCFPARHFAADYCLRLHNHNHRVVFSPQAVLEAGRDPGADSVPAESEDLLFRQYHSGRTDPWIRPATLPGCSSPACEPEALRKNWMPTDAVEFSGGWFFLEQPRHGEKLTAGNQVLSGWCLAKPAANILELKVILGGQARLAVFGLPRPDLAAAMGFTESFFPVGFELEVQLHPGPTQLEFLACVVNAGWQPVTAIELTVLPARNVVLAKLPEPPATTGLTACLEQLLEQAGRTNSMAERAVSIVREVPWPDVARHAAPPFHCQWDEPAGYLRPVYGRIMVRGWLFHETLAIRSVVAGFDLTGWLTLTHENKSPAVWKQFEQFPQSTRCAVLGYVSVPHGLPQPLCFHVWAELEDGSWHLVHLQRCRVAVACAPDPSRLHQVSLTEMIKAVLAIRVALFRCGIPGPGWRVLATIARQLRCRFPFHKTQETMPQPPRRVTRVPPRPHLLLVTHNLNQEGAPFFLLDLARHAQRHLRARLTVVSPADGPLRGEFERLGVTVRLVNRAPLWAACTADDVQDSFDQLARELRVHETSLVVANTIESFWAVHAAHRAGRPSLFYIHEAGVLGLHYLEMLAVSAQQQAKTSLRLADAVSFPSRAVRAYYARFSPGTNYRIQPGWTDLRRIDHMRGALTRVEARLRLGRGPAERLVINVGTLCPRKGQLFFVNAIEHLWQTEPAVAEQCRFLLIGAHNNGYGRMLKAHLARLGRPNIHIVPPTPQVFDYFRAADLFVLSSFEEGFPRVLLEAMGFGLPIVSTAVHAIPEIARAGKEALLVPPGDAPAMATAMQQLMENSELALRLGRQARQRLEANFTATRVLPRHLATIRELACDLKTISPKIPTRDFAEPDYAIS